MKETVTDVREESRLLPKVRERHVQAIWYDAALRPVHIRTRDGREVRVVDPGRWNLTAGPDFLDAVLEIDGRRLKGDVEVHLHPNDWVSHGHGFDPAYHQVIAHVTWHCGPVPRGLPPTAISIWLGRFVTASTSFDPSQIDLTAYPYAVPSEHPCRKVFSDPARARALLISAATARLDSKAARMRGRLAQSEVKQVFYEEVMAALGYSHHTESFRTIAARVPYAALDAEQEHATAAFLAAAAFVPWKKCAERPQNRPKVRLTAAAGLFTETAVMSLCEASDFMPCDCREIVRLLSANHRMGTGRAAAVLANVVVPFALATGRMSEVPEWLPPEDVSSPVRLVAHRIFGRDHNPRVQYSNNGLLIQGLLHLWHSRCNPLYPDCVACLGSSSSLVWTDKAR